MAGEEGFDGVSSTAMTAASFPEELVFQILSWLPVKNLFRFCCVSRRWHHLIRRDPHFAALHLLHSRSPLKTPILILHGDDGFKILSYRSLELLPPIPLPRPTSCPFDGIANVHGPCNGLVCIQYFNRTLQLWNPSTGEFLLLPKPLYRGIELALLIEGACNEGLGLGFHSCSNDYKIICIFPMRTGEVDFPALIDIYELSTGSWRMLDVGTIPACPGVHASDSVFWNGIQCWNAETYEMVGSTRFRRRCILCFDWQLEKFSTLPAPPIADGWQETFEMETCLVERDGYLTLVVLDKAVLDVWRLEKNGTTVGWFQQFKVILKPGFHKFLGFSKADKVLVQQLIPPHLPLVMYDIRTGELVHLEDDDGDGDRSFRFRTRLLSCVENLISLRTTDEP